MEYREIKIPDCYDHEAVGEGPWLNEPDKIQFQDEVTGLPCLIVRNSGGALCGYVGVAEGHPFFGVEYNLCSRRPACEEGCFCEHRAETLIDVHGGLTFSDFCAEDEKETGICHIPSPGEPERVWWLGFDCAHSFDYVPTLGRWAGGRLYAGRPYRTVEYAKSECRDLARQLAAIARDESPA